MKLLGDFQNFLELSKTRNLPRMTAVQNPYNLLNRTYEVGLSEISIREQSGLLAYSPLACGYLSGKYRNNQIPKILEWTMPLIFGRDTENQILIKPSMNILKFHKNII